MGFFKNLFSGPEPKPDFSAVCCDVHSHFIPGIDDGSQNMEDSLLLISELQKMGYKKIITTPHIMSDSFRNTPEIILGGLEKLKAALKDANIHIEIEAAAEYYIDYDFEKKIESGNLLTFGDNYLLFEVSYINPPDNLNNVIFKLQTAGYKPVLAHPERYNFWHRHFEKYKELKAKKVLFQLNINSLTGYYSIATKKIAEQMIAENMIDFIGTDCHHIGHIELLKKAFKSKALKQLIAANTLLNLKA